MRFGVIALQLNSLIPQNISSEDLLNHLMDYEYSDSIEQIVKAGFSLIELSGDLALFLPHTLGPGAITHLLDQKNLYGLTYTIHLPLWSVEPSTPLNPVREGSVNAIIACIEATKPLDPEVYVLHATGALAAEFNRMKLPDPALMYIMNQFQSNARASILKILSETGITSRMLAIETVEYPFELTMQLSQELGVSICFDTGHVIVGFSGPIDVFEALEQSIPNIREIHLHDGPWQGLENKIGYGKDHQALGLGDLDVDRFLGCLEQYNFNGPIIFELGLDEALQSVEFIRSIRSNLTYAT